VTAVSIFAISNLGILYTCGHRNQHQALKYRCP
jgi:hypothetical protein